MTMRINYWAPLLLLFIPAATHAQQTQQAAAAWSVSARDGNSQTWQRTVNEVGPGGQLFPRVHSYVELRTCMNVLSNGQWVTASDQITPTATGAQATNA